MLADREHRLQHSRSTTDLVRKISTNAENSAPRENQNQNQNQNRQRGRRRSTLPWTGVSSLVRQTRLEDIANSRMADTFFSMHCDGVAEPVYVSEVVGKAMNPTFRAFDLGLCGPAVSRQDHVVLRFWAKTAKMGDYFLLLEMQVWLRGLQYIGRTLDSFRQPLPANCVVFGFADGVYTSLTDVPVSAALEGVETTAGWRAAATGDGKEQPTSAYDALMKLANLDDCVQDALSTRERLEGQINGLLEKNQAGLGLMDRACQSRERLAEVKGTATAERSRLRQSQKRRDEMVTSLRARREAMALGRQNIADMQSYLSDARSIKQSSEALLKKTDDDSAGQIRRICEDLLAMYPIEPIQGKPLAFTILDIPLPNSNFDDVTSNDAREAVAAALGYTAHLVHMVSFYISVPLLYPVKPYQSTSYIQDPISAGLAQRTFPLYPVNTSYRFEYGVFLLNKNIEYLMNRLGLRVLDIRHTLPNLKYLLYMLTAGTSELPARKAGGVRGLLGGMSTPGASRRGSTDSAAAAAAAAAIPEIHIRPSPKTSTLAVSSGNQNSIVHARRFHSPSPPPHKLNGSGSVSSQAGGGWQVGRDGQAGVTTMSSGATATAGGFIQ